MAEKSSFIKLDRNILQWGWYKNANTFRVFIHLTLTANIRANTFEGILIERGEVATSVFSLAENLGLTEKQVRTALSHLKSTGWFTERVDFTPDGEKEIIRFYYGSSRYNTRQMSRLIDNIVQDCKALSIEVLPPDKLSFLKEES